MYSAQEIIQRERDLRTARSDVEQEWRLIEKHMVTLRKDLRSLTQGGDRRAQYDSTGVMARRNLAAGLYGQMSNPANRWFELDITDEDMRKSHRVRKWLYQATSLVLASYGPSMTKFYAEAPNWYEGGALYGHALMFSQLRPEVGMFHDQVWSLWDVVLVYDEFGFLSEFYRKYTMQRDAAVKMFGAENVPKIAKEKNPASRHEFIHAVYPNKERQGRNFNFGYISDYVSVEDERTVKTGGYEEMPLFAPRWSTPVGDDYGQGPAHDALLDHVQLNNLERTNAIVAARQARPPMIAANKSVIKTVNSGPAQVTYGGIDRQGRTLVKELNERASPFLGMELSQQKRDSIKDAFYYSLMQLVGRSGMSATEVLEIQSERARLFAPHSGRWQSEGLTPNVIYRFNRLWAYGQIPPPPPELGGSQFKVTYTSPFAKAQKIAEAEATIRFVQGVGLIDTMVPGTKHNLDGDEIVRILQDGYGAPAKVLLDEALRDGARQAEAQQMQMAQMAQVARDGGQAAASMAQAQQVANQ